MELVNQLAEELLGLDEWCRGARRITLFYWVAGLFMAWQTRFLLTPDGFAYAQAAQHYADGSFGLAVNSWWSPGLSWLTVPFIWAKVQPVFAIRLLNVGFGWGFARGVGALTKAISGRGWFGGYLLGLLAALVIFPRHLTPTLVISLHDGTPTINSAARYANLWSGKPDYQAMPFKHLKFPREGRIWSWEDPTETLGGFRPRAVFEDRTWFQKKLSVIIKNLLAIPSALKTTDHFGLISVGLIFSLLCIFPLRQTLKTWHGRLRVWGLVSAFIYMGGYVPSIISDRYLWPTLGILLALFVAGPALRSQVETPAGASARTTSPTGWHWFLSRFHLVFLVALSALLALSVANEIRLLLKPDGDAKYAVVLKEKGDNLKAHSLFVSNKLRPGLYVTYWAGGRFLGEVTGKSPNEIAEELAPFGEPVLMIFGDPQLAEALLNSQRFTLLQMRPNRFWAFQTHASTVPGAAEATGHDF
ncbi:MAG: hypothetical protein HY043_01540 [Verrucomicrobia bacterium]|nr:hypothetical protein [Verrucomicrobiota bacterium]